jgi:4-hydroxythreonine-4-phosphate dehydrogenase
MNDIPRKPVIALTMGDPAGIGPEIIVRCWPTLGQDQQFRYVVFGRPAWLQRNVAQTGTAIRIASISAVSDIDSLDPGCLPVIPAGSAEADEVTPGQIQAVAGRAAFDFIEAAIRATRSGQTEAIVTAPIHKQAMRLAGLDFPGHTEILADRCGVTDFAMMLFIPAGLQVGGDIGLGVVHTTLHQSLRSAIDDLSTEKILSTCRLAYEFAEALLRHQGLSRRPRLAVAALNPHAGENGLFGTEESQVVAPAVALARESGMQCGGPFSCDTLMGRAAAGEFDMVVALYHDQGHIALKLLGMHKAVNVTLGLPLIRTSVAHGTAFEIAGKGQADPASLLRAVEVARQLVQQQTGIGT